MSSFFFFFLWYPNLVVLFIMGFLFLVQTIFDNILNRNIPWPNVPEEMSPEAADLIDQ